MAKNEENAAYQRELKHSKSAQIQKYKARQFRRLVEYAKSIKPLLKKYHPDYEAPKPPTKDKKPSRRKPWILGVD